MSAQHIHKHSTHTEHTHRAHTLGVHSGVGSKVAKLQSSAEDSKMLGTALQILGRFPTIQSGAQLIAFSLSRAKNESIF